MDPAIIFNQYIFEEIFKYIPKKGLKELTLVNKAWCQAITSSSLLMGRFYIGIRGDWMKNGDVDSVVTCSTRNMRNIIISSADEILNEVYEKVLTRPGSYWTTVEIYDLNFQTIEEFLVVIQTIQNSVKNLVLRNIKILKPSETDFLLEMKNLRDLRVSFCDLQITFLILKSSQKVRSLMLHHVPEYNENIADYQSSYPWADSIKDMKSLKKLEMNGEWFAKTFSKPTTFDWQLEEFEIVCDYVMPENDINNFLKFLEDQKNLKKIKLLVPGLNILT